MRDEAGGEQPEGMTTTGEFTTSPPPPPAASPPGRVLRRSRTNRVGAGVAGGLGEYFNLDPVLFRVLFATSAFFGGAGVLLYLLAWAAIPEEGTTHAAVDGWVHELRRRRVPLWVVLIVAVLLLWGIGFSWWAPGPFFPVMVVVVVIVALFARRGAEVRPPGGSAAPPEPGAPTVSLHKQGDTAERPVWVDESRQWLSESRQAARERRRRAFPVRISAVVVLVVVLGILGAVDAGTGIALPVYFWVTFGIVVLALLVGAVLRRTPWSLTLLLVPALAGIVAFGGTDASLHDGTGERDWTPTTSIASEYRLAFGQGTLDLTHLTPPSAPRTVDVTMAAGHVRILLPKQFNARVEADVHIGAVEVDGREIGSTDGARFRHEGGFNIERVIMPPSDATGSQLLVRVHLADGLVSVDHA